MKLSGSGATESARRIYIITIATILEEPGPAKMTTTGALMVADLLVVEAEDMSGMHIGDCVCIFPSCAWIG